MNVYEKIGYKLFLPRKSKEEDREFINDLITHDIPFYIGKDTIQLKESDFTEYKKNLQNDSQKWIINTHKTLKEAFSDKEFTTEEIRKRIGWKKTSIPMRIAGLKNKGLIRSRPDKTDKRRRIFQLTG